MPDGEEHQVPTGSAHYLEHKLFEGREEKVFDRFNRLGANFNGGTSFCTTTYYFSTANHFDECLEVLLDFVQDPLITEERVDKERGIIEQEVRMYQDSPGYHGTFLLHEAMYQSHSVRVGPGGTLEDVARINATDLQRCYDGFYVPQAMRLVVAGDFDVDEMLQKVQPLLRTDETAIAQRISDDATSVRAHAYLEEEFAVTRPHVFIGYAQSDLATDGQQRLQRRIVASLVLAIIFVGKRHSCANSYMTRRLSTTVSELIGHQIKLGGMSSCPEFATNLKSLSKMLPKHVQSLSPTISNKKTSNACARRRGAASCRACRRHPRWLLRCCRACCPKMKSFQHSTSYKRLASSNYKARPNNCLTHLSEQLRC